MPMNKAIAGEGEGWNQGETGIFGFTLILRRRLQETLTQNIPWAKTNIIIAYPDIIIANLYIIIANENMLIANPLSGINRWTVSY